jgi:DNA replication protein DnaC
MNPKSSKQPGLPLGGLDDHLRYLKLSYIADKYAETATKASKDEWPHIKYLATLIEGEAELRQDRATQRRIRQARFPVIKTLDQFIWSWPKKINRLQVQNLFKLDFIKKKANVIFLGGVGLGKTHMMHAFKVFQSFLPRPLMSLTACQLPMKPADSSRSSKNI